MQVALLAFVRFIIGKNCLEWYLVNALCMHFNNPGWFVGCMGVVDSLP